MALGEQWGRGLSDLNRERKGTRTSGFGVSRRESHDSSEFYARKINENIGKRLYYFCLPLDQES